MPDENARLGRSGDSVMSSTPSPASVEQAILSLGSLLATVRKGIVHGIDVDLTGLAEATAGLCASVEALPRDVARPMVEQMAALVEACDAIAQEYALRVAGPAVTEFVAFADQ